MPFSASSAGGRQRVVRIFAGHESRGGAADKSKARRALPQPAAFGGFHEDASHQDSSDPIRDLRFPFRFHCCEVSAFRNRS